MADQKISQLTTIATVDNATDLFPIVDTSVGETKKITPTALKTALALNNVDNTTDALKPISTATQTALNAKQDTLVSATNIKTVNSTSLLGSGNIVIGGGSPSGVAGAIQFSDGTAFASDASNLFWDDTNNRLGVGTNAPSATVHLKGSGSTLATKSLLVQNSAGTAALTIKDDLEITMPGIVNIQSYQFVSGDVMTSASMRLTTTSGGVAINTSYSSANASAQLDVASTTKGFLPPRMTTTQKNAIATPPAGLMVYDTTLNKLCVRTASAWETITSV